MAVSDIHLKPPPPHPADDTPRPHSAPATRLLITAGPTQEPIDAVRFIGNRSSGRLGVSLAEVAARTGWRVTLLLGPTPLQPTDSRVQVRRFRTTADLQGLLSEEFPGCDVLVMAAAVADYRPAVSPEMLTGKHRRTGEGMTISLEATPDLLAGCAARRTPFQTIVGFALEPRAEMETSALQKLARKKVDMIVANPLETMDAATIEATVYGTATPELQQGVRTPGAMSKERFAGWLLDVVSAAARSRRSGSTAPVTIGGTHATR